MQTSGHPTHPHHVFPPPEQRHGGARAPSTERCLACPRGRGQVARTPTLDPPRPTCGAKRRFERVICRAGVWHTPSATWATFRRARTSSLRLRGETTCHFTTCHANPFLLTSGQCPSSWSPYVHIRLRAAWRDCPSSSTPVRGPIPRAGTCGQVFSPTGGGKSGDGLHRPPQTSSWCLSCESSLPCNQRPSSFTASTYGGLVWGGPTVEAHRYQ
jgi:hypothetical protein